MKRGIVDLLQAQYGLFMVFVLLRNAARFSRMFGGPRRVPPLSPFDSRRVATRHRRPAAVQALLWLEDQLR